MALRKVTEDKLNIAQKRPGDELKDAPAAKKLKSSHISASAADAKDSTNAILKQMEHKVPETTVELKREYDKNCPFFRYVFHPDKLIDCKPSKILVFDLDEVLSNAGKFFETIHKIRLLIKLAIEHNILVVCVTARTPEDQLSDHPLSVYTLLNSVDTENFSQAFMTGGKDKYPVLEYLLKLYNLDINSLVLVDDNTNTFDLCDELGFLMIPVELVYAVNNRSEWLVVGQKPHFLEFIETFIKGNLATDQRYQKFLTDYRISSQLVEFPDENVVMTPVAAAPVRRPTYSISTVL